MNGVTNQVPRRIRSYVLRQGRLTPSQQKALSELLPQFALDPSTVLETERQFSRTAPLFLEVGFGNGETLAAMAAARPDHDFVGIEVHAPGIGHLLTSIRTRCLSNIRIYRGDAVEIMERAIPDGSLDGIRVFFPDPWHKKKHQKRRLINSDFVRLAVAKLKPAGLLHAATDWDDYAAQMLSVLSDCDQLVNCMPDGGFSPRPEERPLTKFERRGIRLGHVVRDLLFRRVAELPPDATRSRKATSAPLPE